MVPTCQTASQNSFYDNSAIFSDLFLFLFFYCVFFPSMSSCLYFPPPCFGDSVASFIFIFVIITPCVLFSFFKSLFSAFFAFQLCWCENAKKKKPQAIIRAESRTRDRNGTRVFRSTNVLSGNRC